MSSDSIEFAEPHSDLCGRIFKFTEELRRKDPSISKYDMQHRCVERYLQLAVKEPSPWGKTTTPNPASFAHSNSQVHVRSSRHLPALQGTYASRAYKTGDVIKPVAGWIVKQRTLELFPFFIATAAATTLHCHTSNGSTADPYVILMYPNSAVAHMNSPTSSCKEKANVKFGAFNNQAIKATQLMEDYLVVRASRDIEPNEELLLDYGSNFWKCDASCLLCLMKDSHAKHLQLGEFHRCSAVGCKRGYHSACYQSRYSTTLVPVTCDLHSSQTDAGVSHSPRLLSQYSNLRRFVNVEMAELLKHFKYFPWTTPSKIKPHVQLHASKLIPGTVGVFPTTTAKVKEGAVIVVYGGALMWDELHSDFDSKNHCPTAVRIPILDYEVDDSRAKCMKLASKSKVARNRWLVRVVLVGHPAVGGALINSPFGLQKEPNCVLQTCRKEHLYLYKAIKPKDERIYISSDLLAIHRNGTPMGRYDEYLVAYDSSDLNPSDSKSSSKSAFWSLYQQKEDYCDICNRKFEASTKETNQMFLCDAPSCSTARHKACFGSVGSLYSAHRWFCPEHATSAPLPSSAFPVSSRTLTNTPPRRVPPLAAVAGSTTCTVTMKATHPGPAAAVPPSAAVRSFIPNRPHRIKQLLATPPDQRPTVMNIQRSLLQISSSLTKKLDATTVTAGVVSRSNSVLTNKPATRSSSLVPAPVAQSNFDKEYEDESCSESDSSFSSDKSEPEASDSDSESEPKLSKGGSNTDVSDLSSSTAPTVIQRQSSLHHSKRTQSVTVPLCIKKKPPVLSELQLCQAEVEQIRSVFASHLPRIQSSNKNKIPKWPIIARDYNTPLEKKKLQRLAGQFQYVRQCCGSMESILTMPSAQQLKATAIFKNCSTFLDHRLKHQARCAGFKKNQMMIYVSTTFKKTPPYDWFEIFVCTECFIRCIDFSRSKAFGSRHISDAEKWKRPASGPLLKAVTDALLVVSKEYGQFDPESTAVILPFYSLSQAKEKIEESLNELNGQINKVSDTTLNRAKSVLELTMGKKLDFKNKDKKIARCTQCEALTNALTEVKKTKDATSISNAQQALNNHHLEWKEQRNLFDRYKQEAVLQPWNVNTITLDGMDQAKTELPHRARFSKGTDGSSIPCRVVGAYCFGGPIPCVGITSFDDIPTKGANASVTALEQLIDLQYEAMDTATIAPIPGFEFKAEDVESNHSNSPNIAVAAASAASAASAVPAAAAMRTQQHPCWEDLRKQLKLEEMPKGEVPFMWPKNLHVTFDNTASDCKNSTFISFLACLVALGVYLTITVSNLMVGHTHDIVDAMFGVWAQALKIKDANTLSMLHKVFRENYASSIYSLSGVYKEKKKASTTSTASAENLKDDINTEVSPTVAEHLRTLADSMGVDVRLIHQTFSVDADAWFSRKIAHLSDAYVFYFQKEKEDGVDVVAMYTRHLAESHNLTTAPAAARTYVFSGGPYTSRLKIMNVSDVPQQDPYRVPPKFIDSTKIELCIVKHTVDMTWRKETNEKGEIIDDLQEFELTARTFKENSAVLKAVCQHCHEHMSKYAAIGVISKKHSESNAAAAAFAKQQQTDKTQVEKTINQHLLDPEFADAHEKYRVNGWWTKWIERVRTVIRPYYLSRRLIDCSDPATASLLGRKEHPMHLPAERNAPALFIPRVDVERFAKYGPPKVNDLFICRTTNAVEPFYVGKILAIGTSASGESTEEERHSSTTAAASNAAATPAKRGRGGRFLPKQPGRKKLRRGASLAAAAAASNLSDRMEIGDDEGEEAAEEEDSEEEFEDEDEEDEEEGEEGDEYNMEPLCRSIARRAALPAAAAASSSSSAAIDGNINAAHCQARSQLQAAASNIKKKRAPSAPKLRAGYARVHYHDYKAGVSLSQMDVTNRKACEAVMRRLGVYEQWKKADELMKNSEQAALPWQCIARFKNIPFAPLPTSNTDAIAVIDLATLIYWGNGDKKPLTKSGALKAHVFKDVVRDLSEPLAAIPELDDLDGRIMKCLVPTKTERKQT